ncbi:MAG TPA: sialate O-acetylesterase, partial [Mucilaginibacter sp.]
MLQTYIGMAKVILPALISDHMVLQQKSTIKLWGSCKPYAKVSICPSWSKKHYIASSGSTGGWQISVRTPLAGGPYKIGLDDGEGEVVINDVLLGEVWVCSGQSNMVMPLKGYDKGQNVYGSASVIASSDKYNVIRVFDVPKVISAVQKINTGGNWKLSNIANAPGFSAIAYQFAT